jgi:hypothetical protein
MEDSGHSDSRMSEIWDLWSSQTGLDGGGELFETVLIQESIWLFILCRTAQEVTGLIVMFVRVWNARKVVGR